LSVITISRGSFSGGKSLAQCVARTLGFRCIDRDVIVESAAARGVPHQELLDALAKPPTLLERFQHTKYRYLALIQAALTEEVRTGKAVYHGNAGHLLLKGGPRVLRVRLIAPLEVRVSMAQKRLKLTHQETVAYIQKMDQSRKKWTEYLYGADWADPALYDVVLNLEYMSIPEACQGVSALVRQRCFEFTAEDQAAMDDLALESQVRAELALDPETSHLEVKIIAQRGAVSISGEAGGGRDIEEARRIAERVPGVVSVDVAGLEPVARA
jgi:cytidylate kinase